ncbi:hypothetical protein, partial [Ornithinimicrobium cavernae]|uniref:hypothetical protein n=1 Tax=Ornithinimicrobium cavernae TaxID=2666047 RepID=UPI00192A338F
MTVSTLEARLEELLVPVIGPAGLPARPEAPADGHRDGLSGLRETLPHLTGLRERLASSEAVVLRRVGCRVHRPWRPVLFEPAPHEAPPEHNGPVAPEHNQLVRTQDEDTVPGTAGQLPVGDLTDTAEPDTAEADTAGPDTAGPDTAGHDSRVVGTAQLRAGLSTLGVEEALVESLAEIVLACVTVRTPGEQSSVVSRGQALLAAVETLTTTTGALDAVLLSAVRQLTATTGQLLLVDKGATTPEDLSASGREEWRARAKVLTRHEIEAVTGWGVGEVSDLVALAATPAP